MKNGWYILLYHTISWEETISMRGIGGVCPPDRFRDHLKHLSSIGRFVSLDEGLGLLRQGKIQEPILSFWFDDGLAGVRHYALPLLQQHCVTAAISICSRFVARTEFFWRFKLSYINAVGELPLLRSRLKGHGCQSNHFVKNFTKTHFSLAILDDIDAVFHTVTSIRQRQEAFRIFDSVAGLWEFHKAGWDVTNHTAAHYPVGEDAYAEQFFPQFEECEQYLSALFSLDTSRFWVLPFGHAGSKIQNIVANSPEMLQHRYLVLVGDRFNHAAQPLQQALFRINIPPCSGKELLMLLQRIQQA